MPYYEEDLPILRNSPLSSPPPPERPHDQPTCSPSPSSQSPEATTTSWSFKKRRFEPDPGIEVLFSAALQASGLDSDASLESLSDDRRSSAATSSNLMPDEKTEAEVEGLGSGEHHITEPVLGISNILVATALKATAVAAGAQTDQVATDRRVDSAQLERRPLNLAASCADTNSPLRLRTSPQPEAQRPASPDVTIATSPTLGRHAIPVGDVANTIPVVPPTVASPGQEGTSASPKNERLPSFRQLTGHLNQLDQLDELAEAAATQESQRPSYTQSHKPSFSSATTHSPRLPYHPPYPGPGSAQTSPIHYTYCARSPTSTTGEGALYGSPSQPPGAAYYMSRRSSTVADNMPNLPPSLHSASSSGDSHGYASASDTGYSTSHTTPIDQPPTQDGTPRPILPPPAGMTVLMMNNGGFKCDYQGCTAQPFQTQYLLSSHRNVHSSSRPHYCPVQDCQRSEGGKGFKRKNEMIRHGLVHNSPGYICPFCPDREHKYPRPDNLQRHVRVHHRDKDREDPALRDVLAQRIEGSSKSRKRRTNFNGE